MIYLVDKNEKYKQYDLFLRKKKFLQCRTMSVVDNYFSRFVGSHTGNPNAVLASRKIDVFTPYYLANKILISILYIHTYN